jgi:hypothetical protein
MKSNKALSLLVNRSLSVSLSVMAFVVIQSGNVYARSNSGVIVGSANHDANSSIGAFDWLWSFLSYFDGVIVG